MVRGHPLGARYIVRVGDKRLTTRRKASPPKEASEYLQERNKTCR